MEGFLQWMLKKEWEEDKQLLLSMRRILSAEETPSLKVWQEGNQPQNIEIKSFTTEIDKNRKDKKE